MTQRAIPAVFMRGGTSKALMVHRRDLPPDEQDWAPIFTAAMGSPDPYGRQLDGMGGGVSSLSKVCIIAPSKHPDADVDYTFAQVMIKEARVDYRGNCGNMSSAVGPFAVDQGLVPAGSPTSTVRIFNTNTRKIIHSTFPTHEGRAHYTGDLSIPGVSGTGAPIRLDFIEPGGATTGRLLPTGNVIDTLDVPDLGSLTVSMIDAGNAAVFIRAQDVGLNGGELPDELDSQPELLARLELIRQHASVRMGIAPDLKQAAQITIVPFICLISAAADSPTLSGDIIAKHHVDLVARALSNGQPHRALPLTISLCTAVAARIQGSVVAQTCASADPQATLRLGMPSGVLSVDAQVEQQQGHWQALIGSFYRTARLLFDGRVWVPDSNLGKFTSS